MIMSSPILFADTQSYSHIMQYGQNHPSDWWHPVTEGQFTKYGFQQCKPGDIIPFMLNGQATKVQFIQHIKSGSITSLYGALHIPDWHGFDRFIRVKTI